MVNATLIRATTQPTPTHCPNGWPHDWILASIHTMWRVDGRCCECGYRATLRLVPE